jgi:hypothetical protein
MAFVWSTVLRHMDRGAPQEQPHAVGGPKGQPTKGGRSPASLLAAQRPHGVSGEASLTLHDDIQSLEHSLN